MYAACSCCPPCPARLTRALPRRLARGPRQIPPRQHCVPHGSRRSALLTRRRTVAPEGERSRDGSDSHPDVQHPVCLRRRVDGPARSAVRPRGVHWRDLPHGAMAKGVRPDRQGRRRGREWCVQSDGFRFGASSSKSDSTPRHDGIHSRRLLGRSDRPRYLSHGQICNPSRSFAPGLLASPSATRRPVDPPPRQVHLGCASSLPFRPRRAFSSRLVPCRRDGLLIAACLLDCRLAGSSVPPCFSSWNRASSRATLSREPRTEQS